jgi:hypothetical protein
MNRSTASQKHANAVELKVSGQHLADKPVPRLRERNLYVRLHQL